MFFCLLLFEGIGTYLLFTSFFKDKMSKRSHKAVGIKVLTFLCLVIEGPGSKPLTNRSGSGFGSATLITDELHYTGGEWNAARSRYRKLTTLLIVI
jgi:hypothetical protein